jgi:nucleotide-binding universal stress UspA family protein
MIMRFRKILIPVDFTINTEVAIQKALRLTGEGPASLHLVHVERTGRSGFPSPASLRVIHGAARPVVGASARLENLKTRLEGLGRDIIIKNYVIQNRSVENAIIELAAGIGPELILISKNSRHSWFPFLNTVVPNKIAKRTGIPVLTFKPGSMNSEIKTIVVPLNHEFPAQKVDILNALKKRGGIRIRLLAFRGNDTPDQMAPVLLHVYQLLGKGTFTDIRCDTLPSPDGARAILAYCRKVEADLLVVTPGAGTKTGWMDRQISDLISPDSKTHVLAI